VTTLAGAAGAAGVTDATRVDGVRRALRVGAIAIAGGWLALLLLWNEAPFTLTFDDAYYYFGIARNVAEGHGSTFDQLNATNGYHPLWLAMAVPVYAVGLDGLAAARTLLAVQMVMYGAALVVIADSVARAIGGWSAVVRRRSADDARWCTGLVVAIFVLVFANPFVVKVFVNGLESAVVVVVDAVLLAIAVAGMPGAAVRWVDGRSTRWRFGVGVVLALAFLARTDAVILIGCLGLWCLVEAWPLNGARLRGLCELFGPSALAAVVYLGANWVAFGTPTQISGIVKQASLDGRRLVLALLVVAVAGLVFFGAFRNHTKAPKRTRMPLVASFLRRTGWFAAFSILLIGYYSVLQTQQWLWYYAPAVLYGAWLLVLLVADFASTALVEAPPERSASRTLGGLTAALLLPFVLAAVLQTRVFADPELRSIQLANRDAGEWIAAHLPEDAVLASWDAGVVGYFSERRVVNLDGVVNSYDWYRAAQRGETGARLREAGLGWVVNHGTDVGGRDLEIERFISDNLGAGVLAGSEVENLWPFAFSGVTAGAEGTGSPGDAPQAVFLYRLPPLNQSGAPPAE
jgi:hypothetical protein